MDSDLSAAGDPRRQLPGVDRLLAHETLQAATTQHGHPADDPAKRGGRRRSGHLQR